MAKAQRQVDAQAGASPVAHLRAVETEARKRQFAALDHDVARVLGPQRGAAVLYGFLASAWFEFADLGRLAERNAERRKKITPGDWVSVDYKQFMAIAGTRARDSVARWLRILSEDVHACPWSRCADEHPLIVMERQGQNKPNRYRKWKCGEDERVVRPRIRSEKLREVALRRVSAGHFLNVGIGEAYASGGDVASPSADVSEQQQLCLNVDFVSEVLSSDFPQTRPEVLRSDFSAGKSEVRTSDFEKFEDKTLGSLAASLPEVLPADFPTRENPGKRFEKTAAAIGNDDVAAVEQADEVDAVACEVVEPIIELAARADPSYPDSRAWEVARRLARSALETIDGGPAFARAALLHAIGDRRLGRALNPVGLLIRGVVGDPNGQDRFLLRGAPAAQGGSVSISLSTKATLQALPMGVRDMLLDRTREGRCTPVWCRERDIPESARLDAQRFVDQEKGSYGAFASHRDAIKGQESSEHIRVDPEEDRKRRASRLIESLSEADRSTLRVKATAAAGPWIQRLKDEAFEAAIGAIERKIILDPG